MIILEIILELFGWLFELFTGSARKKKRLTKRDISRAERTPWKRR